MFHVEVNALIIIPYNVTWHFHQVLVIRVSTGAMGAGLRGWGIYVIWRQPGWT